MLKNIFQIKQTIDDEVMAELPKKLENEKEFEDDLLLLFGAMAVDFFLIFSSTQLPPDMSPFLPEIESMIKKHYRKTSEDFKSELRKRFGLEGQEDLTINQILKEIIQNSSSESKRNS